MASTAVRTSAAPDTTKNDRGGYSFADRVDAGLAVGDGGYEEPVLGQMILQNVAEGDVIVDYDDFLDIIECVGSTILHAAVAFSDPLRRLVGEGAWFAAPGEFYAAGI
jgi:hypothetical protein